MTFSFLNNVNVQKLQGLVFYILFATKNSNFSAYWIILQACDWKTDYYFDKTIMTGHFLDIAVRTNFYRQISSNSQFL